MQIREYSLPAGWYPRNPKEVTAAISGYLEGKKSLLEGCSACIAPHAGWYYSGRLAAISISSLKKDADTIAVIGGHLPAGYPVLFAAEDAVRTPFGAFPVDIALREQFVKEMDAFSFDCTEDPYRDNTVEVLLPMVRHFFPDAGLLWLRFPASPDSYEAGKILSRASVKLNRKIAVVGSTDLTHYGLNYGFSPKGSGASALKWVREVNDAGFIKAVEKGEPEEVLLRAEKDSSACSAGAVLGVMGFAAAEGCSNGQLLEYGTSADAAGTDAANINIPDSFVGYAAMGFK